MILSETVDFTDRMKIHLDYDFQRHALNIFVNSTDPLEDLSMPCQINVLVNQPVTVPSLLINLLELHFLVQCKIFLDYRADRR